LLVVVVFSVNYMSVLLFRDQD